MCDSRPTREQLIALAKRDPETIADLVLSLWSRVEALEAKVAELQRNSRTSRKPPSSDKPRMKHDNGVTDQFYHNRSAAEMDEHDHQITESNYSNFY